MMTFIKFFNNWARYVPMELINQFESDLEELIKNERQKQERLSKEYPRIEGS
jgi:hypothetical protein